GRRVLLLGRQDAIERQEAEAVQRPGEVGDADRMANGAADQRQDVVIAKRAFQPLMVIAEHGDEQRFHARNQQGPLAQENAATQAVSSIEHRVAHAEHEDRVKNGLMFAVFAEVDEEIAKEDAEPADLDGDVFRRQFPARQLGVHEGQSYLVEPLKTNLYYT